MRLLHAADAAALDADLPPARSRRATYREWLPFLTLADAATGTPSFCEELTPLIDAGDPS